MKFTIFILLIIFIFFSYNLKAEINTSALRRSAIFAGWGQYHYGAKIKGYIFMGTEVLLLSSSVATYFIQDNAYDNYKSARSDFDNKWDTYINRLYLCWIITGISGAFYLYNLIDAAFITENKNIASKELPLQVKVYVSSELKYDLSYIRKF